MKKFIPLFLIFFLMDWSHAYGSEMSSITSNNQDKMFPPTANYQTEQLIIKFNGQTTYNLKESILQSIQAKELQTIQNGHFTLVSLPKGTDLQEAAASLMKWNEVE